MGNFQQFSDQYNLSGIFNAVFASIVIYFVLSRVALPYIQKLNHRAETSKNPTSRFLGKKIVLYRETKFMLSSLIRIPLYGFILLMFFSTVKQLAAPIKDTKSITACKTNTKKCALLKSEQIEGKWYLSGEPTIDCSLVGTWIATPKNSHYSMTFHDNGTYEIDNNIDNIGRWSLQGKHLLLKKLNSDDISIRSIISKNDSIFFLKEDDDSVTKFEWRKSVKINDCIGEKNRNTVHEQKILSMASEIHNSQE